MLEQSVVLGYDRSGCLATLGKPSWVCALTGLTAGPARKMLRHYIKP
jgi:hypothetical protein